jgi:hypothetical protein
MLDLYWPLRTETHHWKPISRCWIPFLHRVVWDHNLNLLQLQACFTCSLWWEVLVPVLWWSVVMPTSFPPLLEHAPRAATSVCSVQWAGTAIDNQCKCLEEDGRVESNEYSQQASLIISVILSLLESLRNITEYSNHELRLIFVPCALWTHYWVVSCAPMCGHQLGKRRRIWAIIRV